MNSTLTPAAPPHGLRDPSSYDANPHFYRLLTLKKRDEAAERIRIVTYTKAHTESDDDITKILSNHGAVRYDTASQARVVTADALRKVTRLFIPTAKRQRRPQDELPSDQQPRES